jgi:hypothetical protein
MVRCEVRWDGEVGGELELLCGHGVGCRVLCPVCSRLAGDRNNRPWPPYK